MAIATEQVTIIRSGLDPSNYIQGAAKITEANAKISASGDQVVQTTTKTTRSLADNGAAFERYRRQFDQVYAAQVKFSQLQTAADRAVASSRATQEQANTVIAAAAQRLGLLSDTNARVAGTTKSASFAIREFGLQSIDVFQGIATGQPILRTFIQQGGQIVQVSAMMGIGFKDMASAVGGALVTGLRALVSPIGLALTAFAGLGAAAYVVVGRFNDLEDANRKLSVSIAAVGNSANVSVQQLQGYVTELKQSGIAAADAAKIADQLARNTQLNAAQRNQIVRLVPDVSTALGQDPVATQKLLAEAELGQADAVKKLDAELNFLNPNLAATAEASKNAAGAIRDTTPVMAALEERVKGLHDDALSPLEKMFRDLRTSWDSFIDGIVKSDVVKNLVEGWTDIFKGLASAMQGVTIGSLNEERARLEREARDAASSKPGVLGMLGLSGQNPEDRDKRILEIQKQIDQINQTQQRITTAQRSGGAIYGPPIAGLSSQSDVATKALDDVARQRASGLPSVQIEQYRKQNSEFQAELAKLGSRTTENAALFDSYTHAIAANNKAIEDATKKSETHRTESEKAIDKLNAQIDTQNKLADAYRAGGGQIIDITAKLKAQEQAISEGLAPGTAKYTAEVIRLTDANIRLLQSTGQANVEKQINDINQTTEAQLAVNAAYDGTEASLTHANNAQKAYADVLKQNLKPGTDDFTDAVTRETDALDRSAAATKSLQTAQQSVNALTGSLENAFDRLGQSLSDAFVSGSGQAVNFGNIFKAVIASVVSDMVKLAVINPIVNNLFGTSRPTLGGALGSLLGGSSGGSSSSGGGFGINDLLTVGGAADKLTGGSLSSSLTDWLGLKDALSSVKSFFGFGNGGSSGISSILNSGLFGTSTAEAALAAATPGAFGAAAGGLNFAPLAAQTASGASGATGILGGATLGSLAGGFGAGFGVGSLAGGFVQSSLGKVGPAPQIGAGVGAAAGAAIGSIIPGIGTIIGGLIGGLIGGGGGGLIGPKAPTPFAVTNVGVDENGQFVLGASYQQKSDSNRTTVSDVLNSINDLMRAAGVKTSGSYGQYLGTVGSVNGAGGGRFEDPRQITSLTGFIAPDNPNLNRFVEGKNFANFDELNAVITKFFAEQDAIQHFLVDTNTQLQTLGKTTGTYNDQMKAINDSFNAQIDAAKQLADLQSASAQQTADLAKVEADLTAARDKAVQKALDEINYQGSQTDIGLVGRQLQAKASISGTPEDAVLAQLYAFDNATAVQQRRQLHDSLIATFGDAFESSQGFADQMALLEQTLGQERLAIETAYWKQIAAQQKTYNDQIAAQQQAANDNLIQQQQQAIQQQQQAASAAADVIGGITDYLRKFQIGSDSPLSSQAQYDLASSQFNAVSGAAIAGDFNSAQQFTSYADALAGSARSLYGSGAGYAQAVDRILTAAGQIGAQGSEALTASVMRAETRTQTQVLGDKLDGLRAEVASLRGALQQVAAQPAQRAA